MDITFLSDIGDVEFGRRIGSRNRKGRLNPIKGGISVGLLLGSVPLLVGATAKSANKLKSIPMPYKATALGLGLGGGTTVGLLTSIEKKKKEGRYL